MGIFIAGGAGIGLVMGMVLFGVENMVWGLIVGAALGTVAGAAASSSKKQ